ncbi:MAG: ubiquinone/menaquinone biosynthesis methyltransferase [Planctomycetota bacterium]|nr:MAG: ubiquinone/menaquinone biosynthesis methyltransferase [Planctomycetota bacterium]
MFSQIADRYDFMNHFLSLGTDVYWRARAVRFWQPRVSGPALDVCTGTGDVALALWRHDRGGRQVWGTDFTHPMVRLAARKARRRTRQAERWRRPLPIFLTADTLRLPFPDDAFALVCVAFGIRNVEATEAALAEMTRVCRPGGCVGVLEFAVPTWPPWKQIYLAYFRHVLPRLGQLLARNRSQAYHYLPSSVAVYPQREDFCRLMESAGLTNVRFRPLTGGVAVMYRGEKPSA